VTARFHAPDAASPGDLVTLPPDESEHLTRVLRLGAGAHIRVFNGRGGEFDAIVEAGGRDIVQVRLGQPREAAPEPRLAVTLAQAVLKGDKMDDVVRDAVMIGVAAIRPFLAARTEISEATLARGHRRERWDRVAISSAKQCGRAIVPQVFEPVAFDGLIKVLHDNWLAGPALMLVEPGAAKGALTLGELPVETPPRAVTAVIGPEGGWTAEEIEAATAVCRLVTLGQRILRADTMGLVATAAIYTRWNEF
jgi:16S rRNA (uracil1498-N3)-methyltransferase